MTHHMTDLMPQNLEFIGFEPSENIVERALEKLGRVFGESPSDAATTATLKKTRKGFEGHVAIHSAVGSFVADVIGEDPLAVMHRLSLKIRSQLRVWKRSRQIDTSGY